MTGKQLLELLQNTTTFTVYEQKEVEGSLEKIGFYTSGFFGKMFSLNELEEIQNLQILKIDLRSNRIEIEELDSQPNNSNFVTIENLLETIKSVRVENTLQISSCTSRTISICNSKDIPIEITVKTARGNENIYLFGANLDAPGKKKPYGWNRVKDLIVEEITEINSSKKFVLRITAREQ